MIAPSSRALGSPPPAPPPGDRWFRQQKHGVAVFGQARVTPAPRPHHCMPVQCTASQPQAADPRLHRLQRKVSARACPVAQHRGLLLVRDWASRIPPLPLVLTRAGDDATVWKVGFINIVVL